MLLQRNPSGISGVLLKQAIDGDENAFKTIYNMFSGTLYGICLRYSIDDQEANDIFQEAFVNIYLNLSKFRNEGSFEGWAKVIVIRACLDHVKKRQPTYFEIDNVSGADSEQVNGIDRLSMNELVKIIQTMPDGYRSIINLYFVEGYNHREIADLLNISEGTSKSQLSRAKIILKQKLTNKGE